MTVAKVGDSVRRQGMMARLFGDEHGTVKAVVDDNGRARFEVDFGYRRTLLYETQIACVPDSWRRMERP
jgi:hypothetical protein